MNATILKSSKRSPFEMAQEHYEELGFENVEDLVAEALDVYLRERRFEQAMASLERAAQNPGYVQMVREISEDFKFADAENLPPEY